MGTPHSYGGFAFDALWPTYPPNNCVCSNWQIQRQRKTTITPIPRSDVQSIEDSGQGASQHTLTIEVWGKATGSLTAQQDFRNRLHALTLAFTGGTAQRLYRNSDKYWWAVPNQDQSAFTVDDVGRKATVQFTLDSPDPFLYWETAQAMTFGPWSAGTPSVPGAVVTNPGEQYCYPVITITGPLTGPVTISNMSASPATYAQYTASLLGGQSVTIDCNAKTVLDQSGNNQMANFTGDTVTWGFVRLFAGANTIGISCGTSNNNAGTVGISFTPRDSGVD